MLVTFHHLSVFSNISTVSSWSSALTRRDDPDLPRNRSTNAPKEPANPRRDDSEGISQINERFLGHTGNS